MTQILMVFVFILFILFLFSMQRVFPCFKKICTYFSGCPVRRGTGSFSKKGTKQGFSESVLEGQSKNQAFLS